MNLLGTSTTTPISTQGLTTRHLPQHGKNWPASADRGENRRATIPSLPLAISGALLRSGSRIIKKLPINDTLKTDSPGMGFHLAELNLRTQSVLDNHIAIAAALFVIANLISRAMTTGDLHGTTDSASVRQACMRPCNCSANSCSMEKWGRRTGQPPCSATLRQWNNRKRPQWSIIGDVTEDQSRPNPHTEMGVHPRQIHANSSSRGHISGTPVHSMMPTGNAMPGCLETIHRNGWQARIRSSLDLEEKRAPAHSC